MAEKFKPLSKRAKLDDLLEIASVKENDVDSALRRSPKDLRPYLTANGTRVQRRTR